MLLKTPCPWKEADVLWGQHVGSGGGTPTWTQGPPCALSPWAWTPLTSLLSNPDASLHGRLRQEGCGDRGPAALRPLGKQGTTPVSSPGGPSAQAEVVLSTRLTCSDALRGLSHTVSQAPFLPDFGSRWLKNRLTSQYDLQVS